MKMKLFFLILSLASAVLPNVLHSQPAWERIGSVSFRDIHIFDDHSVLLCTDAGSIYKSTDYGVNWNHKLINSNRVFTSMSFSGNFGIMGGTYGKILLTNNGGIDWSEKSTPISTLITCVSAPSNDTLYGVSFSGSCIRSIDAGITWALLSTGVTVNLTKIFFLDSRHGFITGDSGLILTTIDAGENWKKIETGQKSRVLSIDVIPNGRMAIGFTESIIGTSSDFGAHWNYRVFRDTANADTLAGPFSVIKITRGDTVVAYQNSNVFYYISIDFGKTWKAIRINPNYQIDAYGNNQYYSIGFRSDGTGLCVGGLGSIIQVSDFGLSAKIASDWDVPIGIYTTRVYIKSKSINQNELIGTSQNGGCLTSTNRGVTWYSRHDPSYGTVGYIDLLWTKRQSAVIVNWGRSKTILTNAHSPNYETTNDGLSWDSSYDVPRDNLVNTYYDKDSYYYVFGDSAVYRTTDEAQTWTKHAEYFVTKPQYSNHVINKSLLLGGYVFNKDSLYLFPMSFDSILTATSINDLYGYSLSFVVSTDAGATWEQRFLFPENRTAARPVFLSPKVGFILSDSFSTKGICYKTTDGGFHWSEIPGVKTDKLFNDMKFRNDREGIILAADGTIFYTTDGGESWGEDSLLYIGGKKNITSVNIAFYGDSCILITSAQGLWSRSTYTKSLVLVNGASVSNPYLYISAYPSPANGNLIHCTVYGLYSVLPESVSLNMFDVLGRNIMDLSPTVRNNSNGAFSSFDIPISSVSTGVYSLILTTSHGGFSRNVIVVK